jgi:hypothetical protein
VVFWTNIWITTTFWTTNTFGRSQEWPPGPPPPIEIPNCRIDIFYKANIKFFIQQSGVREVSADLFSGFDLGVLVSLDLSGNELEAVPEVVLQLIGLQSLNLADNRILKLPPGSAFNSLNYLTYLDLSDNR